MASTDSSAQAGAIVATKPEAGLRLDVFLARRLPDLSRAQIQRLIRDGHVSVGGRQPRPSLVVEEGLEAAVTRPALVAAEPQAESMPLTVIYDDKDLVVVDKPAGVVVHPAAGHRSGTLVNALLHHVGGLSGIGGVERPGIVHRLDRGTSGLMVVAKHDRAHRELARQFHDREVRKEYVALVWGAPRADQTLTQAIGRDRRHRQKMSTRSARPRAAQTTIVSVEPLRNVSFVRVSIGTGRTHQIRVHLSEIGHPIVGDALYGGVRPKLPAHLASLHTLQRPFLHASRLAFAHPTDARPLSFEAPLPADLSDLLSALRRSANASR